MLGDDHPQTISVTNNLALLLLVRSAPHIYRHRRRAMPRVSTALRPLSTQAQGELSEAEPLFVACVARFKEQLGAKHMSTLSAQHNLAGCLSKRGDLEGAEKLYREVITGFRAALGDTHPQTQARAAPAPRDSRCSRCSPTRVPPSRPSPVSVASRRGRRVIPTRPASRRPPSAAQVVWTNLGAFLGAQKKFAEAEAVFREQLDVQSKGGTVVSEETKATAAKLCGMMLQQARGGPAPGMLLSRRMISGRRVTDRTGGFFLRRAQGDAKRPEAKEIAARHGVGS